MNTLVDVRECEYYWDSVCKLMYDLFPLLTLLTSDDYILNIIYISCIFAEATFQQM